MCFDMLCDIIGNQTKKINDTNANNATDDSQCIEKVFSCDGTYFKKHIVYI